MSINSIRVEEKNFYNLLINDQIFYSVPNYQRPYSWNEDNISEFISDLTTAFSKDKESEYFCGSIVLVEPTSQDNDLERNDIVDGQQRLTTFSILSFVILKGYNDKLNEKSKGYLGRVLKSQYDENEKIRILVGSNHYAEFKKYFINDNFEFQDVKKVEKDLQDKDRYYKNAHHIKIYLEQYISELKIDINNFVDWLSSKIIFTVVTCLNKEKAIKIFNVLNNRGMPLGQVDMFKAMLLNKINNREEEEKFSSKWEQIIGRIGLDNMETFFRVYAYYKIARPPKKQLLEEELDEKCPDVIEALEEICAFSKSYERITTSQNKYIECLKLIPNKTYWKVILCSADFIKYQDFDELCRYIFAFYYQCLVAGISSNKIRSESFSLLKTIKESEKTRKVEEVKAQIASILKKKKITENFKEWFEIKEANDKRNNVYNTKWIKPLLAMLEIIASDEDLFLKVSYDRMTIEHILPKNPSQDWTFSQKENEIWKNSLANLILVSQTKNQNAGNKSFKEKKKYYTDTQSSLSFPAIREVCQYEQWTPKTLLERERKLKEKVEEILDIF